MKNTFKIMAIDPGSNMLGVAIYELDEDLEIVNIETVSINIKVHQLEIVFLDPLMQRLAYLRKYLKSILEEHEPTLVTIESGFINSKRPAAVIPLTHAMSTLLNTIIDFDPLIKIFRVSPSVIKINVGASFKADKDEVTEMVGRIPEIKKHIDVRSLTEHEVDGIAINYTCLKTIRTDGRFLLC